MAGWRSLLLSTAFLTTMVLLALGSDDSKSSGGGAASASAPSGDCALGRSCLNGCGEFGRLVLRSKSAEDVTAAVMLRVAEGCTAAGDVVRCKSGEPVRPALDGPCGMKCLEKAGFNGNLPTFYARCH